MLTKEEVQAAVPSHVRVNVSQELVDTLNNVSSDPEFARTIRENFISYTGVLKDGKFKIEDYLSAVAYVSYKLMGFSNKDSYARTFPLRYQGLVARGASDKDISAYVAAYNKNKLVNIILDQSLIPVWVLNQDAYQAAINTQVDLMKNANSELVRTQAANSILTHIKRPEKQQVELSIGEVETAGMKDLREMLSQLATQQRDLIGKGVPTKEIAHQKLVNGPSSSDDSGVVDGVFVDVTPARDSDE